MATAISNFHLSQLRKNRKSSLIGNSKLCATYVNDAEIVRNVVGTDKCDYFDSR